MGEFFGSLYCAWFEELFGIDLAEYLWGNVKPISDAADVASNFGVNSFVPIGFTMLGISLFVVILYYYIINHPKLNTWWGWLIFLGANAVINFVVGWQWLLRDYFAGKMDGTLMTDGGEVAAQIGVHNIVCFGLTNAILATFAFIIFTFICKWWSTNCSHSPF